jgi:hypothetical protein
VLRAGFTGTFVGDDACGGRRMRGHVRRRARESEGRNTGARFCVIVVALVATCAVVGCGSGGSQQSAKPTTLAELDKCFKDAGATKATRAGDLAFAAADVARLNYQKEGPVHVAGTDVYEIRSPSDPGYAVFIVAKPDSASPPDVGKAVSDPTSVAGVYFVRGDRPKFQDADACIRPAAGS